jgi:hypothetical protein
MPPTARLRFGLVSAMAFGLYVLLSLQYPLAASLQNPRASWTSMVAPTAWNAWLHLAIYVGVTLIYVWQLRLLRPSEGAGMAHPRWWIGAVVVAWLACSAALLGSAPAGESHDIFDYIVRGRMMTEYAANPLSQVPSDLPGSAPYRRYAAWYKNVDTYGPMWEVSSAAVSVGVRGFARGLGWWEQAAPSCPSSAGSCRLLVAYVTAYRLLAILLTGLSGWLIFRIVQRRRPSLALPALAAWLLCPITAVATALGGHNDALMLVFILVCVWMFQRDRPFLAMMALLLAAHVKLTALIWLPACGLWVLRRWGWKRAWRTALASAAAGLTLSALLYAPFGGWGSLPRMLHERSVIVANSWWRLARYILISEWRWPVVAAERLTSLGPSLLYVAGAIVVSAWILGLLTRRQAMSTPSPHPGDDLLWRAILVSSVLYLAVGSFWFQSWYVMWAVAPAALLPRGRFTRFVLPWLALGALGANAASDFLGKTILNGSPSVQAIVWPLVIIWAPALAAGGVVTIVDLYRKAARTPRESAAA